MRHNPEKNGIFQEVKAGLAILGVVAGGYLTFADSKVDILGDRGTTKSREELIIEADQTFASKYRVSSSAGKIAMLYGGDAKVTLDLVRDGNGILGNYRSTWQRIMTVGQECLKGTGYDTTPANIRIRGLAYGGGDVSTIATVNEDLATGEVLVYPASGQGATLRFKADNDGVFMASDEATVATLRVNGCDPTANPLG